MNALTFSDLFAEIKLEIFKYFNQNERIIYGYVSREWRSILSLLPILQETIAIGQDKLDSTDRIKLSVCNINDRHNTVTPFNTIDFDVLKRNTTDDGQKVVSRLLKSFENLRSLFIYAPVKINLSDLPDTIEHIHFGHNVDGVITFDKINFPKLTCISTIDAHLNDHYLNGITNLMAEQKLQLENLSLCEVPRSMCEHIIEMSNLKQLFVFDFKSDFDDLYREKQRAVMDAHPRLQYFNMFLFMNDDENAVCPTESINWLMELGSTDRPLGRKFLIDVFEVQFEDLFELSKDVLHGLHLSFLDYVEVARFETKLNSLMNLRLSYRGVIFTQDTLRLSLELHLGLVPNVRNIQLRFFSDKIFEDEQWMVVILSATSMFAQKNLSRTILLELSAFGEPPVPSTIPHFSKNLNVVLKSLRDDGSE